MKHPVLNLLVPMSDEVYTDPHFIDHVEICLPVLKQHLTEASKSAVQPILGVRYEGDVAGFLQAMSVHPGYKFPTMRLNDMRTNIDVSVGISEIKLVPNNVFERFRKLYQATYSKR